MAAYAAQRCKIRYHSYYRVLASICSSVGILLQTLLSQLYSNNTLVPESAILIERIECTLLLASLAMYGRCRNSERRAMPIGELRSAAGLVAGGTTALPMHRYCRPAGPTERGREGGTGRGGPETAARSSGRPDRPSPA